MNRFERGEDCSIPDHDESRQFLKSPDFEKAICGDVAAFGEVVAFYEKLVFNISMRMMGSAEDAFDITQESFIKLFKNIKSLNDARHIKSWLCRVAHNLCVDELRKRRHRPSESLDDSVGLEDKMMRQFKDDAPGPEESLLRQENILDLERALERLSNEYKIMIVLRDIHGLSYQEISEITELEMGTVKSRLSRARVRLRYLFLREQRDLKIVTSIEDVF